MRRIIYLITTLALVISTSCMHSQSKDEQIISMLREFYIAHNIIWETKPPLSPKILDNRIDSLQQIYCTSKLRLESKKYLELGHDLLTNDFGGTNSEKFKSTLTIVKDTTKENTYIVSYVIEITSPSNSYEKKNIIHLTVIKESNNYKIDKVE